MPIHSHTPHFPEQDACDRLRPHNRQLYTLMPSFVIYLCPLIPIFFVIEYDTLYRFPHTTLLRTGRLRPLPSTQMPHSQRTYVHSFPPQQKKRPPPKNQPLFSHIIYRMKIYYLLTLLTVLPARNALILSTVISMILCLEA